ncbi:MAG TPA: serine/threonine-protein kinase PknK, partial [Arenimonas sp.]|nr:serine/threonine-protein kinase PknK [Arenimonas sp.]
MKLAGYTVKEVIYAVDETVVARAESSKGKRVVLKYQDSSHPSLDLFARWHHEYAVLQSIHSEWVIRALALKPMDSGLVLVLEDFGSCNLAQLIDSRSTDLSERIAFSVQLCNALSAVHQHRLIHGDISAKNVLVDVAALKLKLCDFGLSTRLDRERKPGQDALMRGTLEYMSPEQTGRTSLDVDYRSDFYSLGVTLYELFAGRTPFQSSDPMTLLHAQIAIVPTPLHEIDPTIPEPISKIVQKLLAKSPDDRYQSSFGLHHDLITCAQQWHRYRRIEDFPLATSDVPERFFVSNRLYGRDAESAAILDAFEHVSTGQSEMLLISGYSGIGKTALVGELHRPIVARRGYFVRGKFDQYSRNQPYSALIQAFQQLLRQLSVEGEPRRHYWKAEQLAALGDNVAAITEIIPDLRLLVGQPPSLPPLPPAENENRLHIAFGQFVKALSSSAHPLVLFLDDLQWADPPTLKLLERLLCSDARPCVLVIGAFRDNEVDEHHPLTLSCRAIAHARGPITQLRLRNLDLQQVSQLIADSLHANLRDVAELAELCLEKTQGNPFFLSQFLETLQQNGEIHYARSVGGWRWNIERIRQRGMTDNVVVLMLDKLKTLPAPTQALLALAAHLGDSFDMRKLMAVGRSDAEHTADVLWPALQEGLIVALNEDYKFTHNPERLQRACYRFLHDRVQQAAYGLTDEAERPALQLRSGRLLLAESTEDELDERLFTILGQLNPASALIDDADERAQLCQLNVRGGIRAKSASAYATAVGLLRQARQLLPADAWQAQPEQTLQLFTELAEAEYLAGNFEQAEQLYPEGMAAADDAIAKVTLCLVQSDQYQIQGRFEEGLGVLLKALHLLGLDFPIDNQAAGAVFPEEFARTQEMLGQHDHAQLLAATEMSRPEDLLEMRIYWALSNSTYQTGRLNAFVVDACRMVQATLRNGQSDLACIGYVAYVTAMSAIGQPYPACYRMGKLALTLAEQRENKYFRLTTYQYFSGFYQHWCEPLTNSFDYLDRGVEWGQSGVNPLSAGYAALLGANNKLVQGVALEDLEAECERGLGFLQRSHQPNTEAMMRYGVLLPVQALREKTLHRLSFDSADCSATEFFRGDYRTPSIPLALYSAAMIRHAYLLGDRPLWQQFSANLGMIGQCLPDGPGWTDACFYTALGLLRPELADAGQAVANAEAADTHVQRFKSWSEGCTENYLHKYLLIAAEQARMQGQDKQAMDLYAQAI